MSHGLERANIKVMENDQKEEVEFGVKQKFMGKIQVFTRISPTTDARKLSREITEPTKRRVGERQ